MRPSDKKLAYALSIRLADGVSHNQDMVIAVSTVLYGILSKQQAAMKELWQLGVIEEDYFDELD